jgi:phage N-6-adenine-methyltransferase
MSLVGFQARNHPQQVRTGRARADVDDRAISAEDFAVLNRRFGFTLDVAATAANARCQRYYDQSRNGLTQSWASEIVWCNPPYSDIEPWVRKAWSEHQRARTIVMLLPANRTEQGWWQRHIEPHRDRLGSPLRVEFLPGRMRFIRAGSRTVGPNERPPFGCCLLIWSGEHRVDAGGSR